MKRFVYQIFYDEATRQSLDAGFIPLDNTANERPDWYEFWVIRNFLKTQPLEEDAWYGFLSPNLTPKSGFTSGHVMPVLDAYPECDVALFTVGWEQLAYFQNPFEQGEMCHPGLLDLSQQFLDCVGIKLDLKTLITHHQTSVFSNYIVAKPSFWHAWLRLADQFFEWVEAGAAQVHTTYGEAVQGIDRIAPMKTFIQERLASIVLSQQAWTVFAPDQSSFCTILTPLFEDSLEARAQFSQCNKLKAQYCTSGDPTHLQAYQALRSRMVFRGRVNPPASQSLL